LYGNAQMKNSNITSEQNRGSKTKRRHHLPSSVPAATDYENPPLGPVKKSTYNLEAVQEHETHLLNTNRKPWSIYRMVT
jgi:hypothetical protein